MHLSLPKGRKTGAIAISLTIALFVGVFYFVGAATAPSGNPICPTGYQYLPTVSTQTGLATGSGACLRLTVVITHQEQRNVNLALLAEGFTASCYSNCVNGITYTEDPTVIITGQGHDFEQCRIFGSSSSNTCLADSANVLGLSQSTSTPATGDTDATPQGVCQSSGPNGGSLSGLLSIGGLADAIGTVGAGPALSTVTTTVQHTFTAMETDNNVQVACLDTEIVTSAHAFVYAEGTFGPDSLVSGNTFQITWSIART